MYKSKNWDLLSPIEQEALRVNARKINRKYREANAEKCRESRRKNYEANREKKIEYARKWAAANLDKVRESKRKNYKANPEKSLERKRKLRHKTRQQTAADQFFILAGAAEQLTKLKPKQ